jgi:hypothetical protein
MCVASDVRKSVRAASSCECVSGAFAESASECEACDDSRARAEGGASRSAAIPSARIGQARKGRKDALDACFDARAFGLAELGARWALWAGPAVRQNQARRMSAAKIDAPVVLEWAFASTSGLLDRRRASRSLPSASSAEPSGDALEVGDDGLDESGVIRLASELLRWKGVLSVIIGLRKTELAGEKNESVANMAASGADRDEWGAGWVPDCGWCEGEGEGGSGARRGRREELGWAEELLRGKRVGGEGEVGVGWMVGGNECGMRGASLAFA